MRRLPCSSLVACGFATLALLFVAGPSRGDDASSKAAKKSTAKLGVIELNGEYPEAAGRDGLFGEMQPNLNQVIARIDKAAHDDKVAGLLLEIRDPELGRGKITELRAAIARVRKAGKRVYADIRDTQAGDYLLASSCDEIVMPESGTLAVTGVRAEVSFYKDLLDKLGIKADVLQMGAYKGTGEIFTRDKMSPEFHKDIDDLVGDIYDQMIDTIAADRKLDRGHVKDLIDDGIFSATRAKDAGLIDRVAYRDQLLYELAGVFHVDEVSLVADYGKKQMDTDFSGFNGFMKFVQLLSGAEGQTSGGTHKRVAIVYAVGPIVDGDGKSGMLEDSSIGGDTLLKALRQAENDSRVVGIVLRIDSPGGSALASDLVWREVTRCKKPLVASMGNVAASGGYYIAMGARKIVAEPGTITGSIGVVGGKIALKGLYDKIGITTEVISRGKNSGWLSSTDPFTPSERDAWSKMMMDMYGQFTKKAAEGRKIDLTHLRDDLAGGRVFTGKTALGLKLVDQVGTLDDAVADVKAMAGLKADEPIDRLELPKSKGFFESLLGGESAMDSRLALGSGELARLAKSVREAEMFGGLLNKPAALVMPYRLEIK